MKTIQGTKKKKNLFIKIILPLIIEENNRVKLDRKKLFIILNKSNNSAAEKRWLNKKFKQYGVLNKDLLTLKMIKSLSIKDITNLISKNTNVSKKEIYNFCLKLKNEK